MIVHKKYERVALRRVGNNEDGFHDFEQPFFS